MDPGKAGRCLVVDADDEISDLLTARIVREGFLVGRVTTGSDALEKCRETQPDVIILDTELPDMSGQQASRMLREFTNAYIVMLNSFDNEVDRVVALSTTVDDYISKDVSMPEIIARIRAMLRRPRMLIPESNTLDRTEVFAGKKHVGQMVIDLRTRSVISKDRTLSLTRTEFEMLNLLTDANGSAVARDVLVERVWGGTEGISAHSVDVHIHNLRRKLQTGESGISIDAIRGLGFRLSIPE